MAHDISKMRENYKKGSLSEDDLANDPIVLFNEWLDAAIKSEIPEPNAMNLATVNEDGRPTSRIVLLKEVQEGGFIFYTNYESKKAQNLDIHPYAALNFLWKEVERQVRIEGIVKKVPKSQSEAYFHSRPYGSQVGAISSHQSHVIDDRSILEKRYQANFEKYKELGKVPLPENWGGYILEPDYIEFWQGRESRLHDRICFSRKGADWKVQRLEP